MTPAEGDRLALWSGTGVLLVCMMCAGVPTCCLWSFGDMMSKDGIGPPFWVVGGLIGIGIGLASGLLGCLLARIPFTRELLIKEPVEMVGGSL